MSVFEEVSDVVAHLSRRRLPFTWYSMGPDGGVVRIDVAPEECEAAVDHFARDPLALADGTPVAVVVEPRRGGSWVSLPPKGSTRREYEPDVDRLVGLDRHEAASRATAAGWIVRAHEREAVVTADHHPGRLNLCVDDDGVVTSVHRG